MPSKLTRLIIIYKIINKINGKLYIGQTMNPLHRRLKQHCAPSSGCPFLSNAIRKYGKANFVIKLITVTHTQELADQLERHFITTLQTRNRKSGYNICVGGPGGPGCYTKKARELISQSTKGKPKFALRGVPKSPEHRKNWLIRQCPLNTEYKAVCERRGRRGKS